MPEKPAPSVEDLLARARGLMRRDPAKAEDLAQQALEQAGPMEEEAHALAVRSNARYLLARLDAALDDTHRARELYEEAGNDLRALRSWLTEVSILRAAGRLEAVERIYEELQESLETVADPMTKADFLETQIVHYGVTHAFQKAADLAEQAEPLVRGLDNPPRLIAFLLNYGSALIGIDEFDRAEPLFLEARQIAERIESPLLFNSTNALAQLYIRKGDLPSALDQAKLTAGSPILAEFPPEIAAQVRLTYADVLLRLGCPGEALQIALMAEEYLREAEMPRPKAECLAVRGRALRLLGNRDSPDVLARAAALHAELGEPRFAAGVMLEEATALRRMERFGEALDRLEQAMILLDEHPLERALAGIERAELLTEMGKPRESLEHLRSLEGRFRSSPFSSLTWPLAVARGRAADRLGMVEEARRAWEEAARTAERVEARLSDPISHLGWRDQRSEPFERLLALTLEEQGSDPDRVFAAMERGRARTLLQIVMAGNSWGSAGDSDTVAKLRGIQEEYYWLSEGGRSPGDAGPAAGRRSRLDALEAEARILLRRLGHYGLDGATATSLDLSRFQSMLASDTALIEYAVTEAGTWALVVETNGARVVELSEDPRVLSACLEELHFHLQGAHIPGMERQVHLALAQVMRRLKAILVDPLGELPAGSIIVPHGPLHHVPFEGLLPHGQLISVLPAASFLPYFRQQEAAGSAEVLTVGHANRHAPGAEGEARRIGSFYPSARTLRGSEATVEGVLRAAEGCRLIHLAGHLTPHPDNPLFTGFQLADAPLTPLDTHRLQIPGSTVFLSACSTGAGPVSRSEEVMAFHRGFMAAGARHLVATLWPVADEAAQWYAEVFHGELAAGKHPAQAMAKVRQEALLAERPLHEWSGYRLFGSLLS